MKENNGSEESQKEDMLNQKVDNSNKVKPVSVRYVPSLESIVDIPVIQEEASIEENTTRSRYGRKRSKSKALMRKNFVYTALINEEDDDLEFVTSRVSKVDAINIPINEEEAPRKESITRSRYDKKRSKSVALMRKKGDEDVYNTPKKQKVTVKSHKTMKDAKKSKFCKKGKQVAGAGFGGPLLI